MTQTDPEMQRREAYIDVGTTTRCSPGLHVTDPDSSRQLPVSGTSGYVGETLRGGLTTLDDDDEEDHPWVDEQQRQQSAVVDVDYCQFYDHTAAVHRSCDLRRRRTNSNSWMTWNGFRNPDRCSVYYNDSISSPASWPDNGYKPHELYTVMLSLWSFALLLITAFMPSPCICSAFVFTLLSTVRGEYFHEFPHNGPLKLYNIVMLAFTRF